MAHGLIDSTEMYLRTVLELEEEGIPAIRARLAERLGLSAPSVSEGVARLETEGLLVLDDERIVRLTDDGRDLATRVLRKHRLAERLLVDVIGLEREFVHEEACRWEHVISDRVEEKLAEFLGNPTTSPYGNPIPGAGPAADFEILTLADAEEGAVRIERISEQLQGQADLMHLFDQHGVSAGSTVEVTQAKDGLVLRLDSHEVPIDLDEAKLVYISQLG